MFPSPADEVACPADSVVDHRVEPWCLVQQGDHAIRRRQEIHAQCLGLSHGTQAVQVTVQIQHVEDWIEATPYLNMQLLEEHKKVMRLELDDDG